MPSEAVFVFPTIPKALFKHSEQAGDVYAEGEPELREVEIASVTELGNVSSNSTFVKRDLGFQGKLGPYVLLTYGDTMYSDHTGSDEFRGMTCNSTAFACEDPTNVFDPVLNEHNHPHCFLMPSAEDGEDPTKWSLGITNIVETGPGEGILYFLLNYRPYGKDNLVGSGVAQYGDVCALRAGQYIYAYGHAKDNPWVYLVRVPAHQATDLNSYKYWNGETWQDEKLKIEDLSEKESIFWQVNQGQVIWSIHHQCFLFIYCDNFWSCQVLIRTALAPQGPWSDPLTVHKPKPIQEGGNVYAAVPHPYFDTSGKTLVITYTNHPNIIQAIKVEFK